MSHQGGDILFCFFQFVYFGLRRNRVEALFRINLLPIDIRFMCVLFDQRLNVAGKGTVLDLFTKPRGFVGKLMVDFILKAVGLAFTAFVLRFIRISQGQQSFFFIFRKCF